MTRKLLGLLGGLATAYGGWLLLERGGENLVGALVWLVGGVVVHDAVLSPIVIGLAAVAGRLLPNRLLGPMAAGALVLGAVTLVAVPVLGRFGARPDNPTLLDRSYGTGWLVLAGLTVVGVVVMVAADARHRKGHDRGPSSRR